MKISEVQQLLTAAYVDWSHVLINPQYIRSSTGIGPCITWTRRIPRMLDHPVMASHVSELFDEGQYTFQIIEDGSLIQMYYQYNSKGDELMAARLAFYSARTDEYKRTHLSSPAEIVTNTVPDISGFSAIGEAESTLDDMYEATASKVSPISFADGPVSWLRIEYEPRASRGILHHDCHMHLSAFPYSRFVVAGIPTPTQFIEFIMSFCYSQIYKEHRLTEKGLYANSTKITAINSTCFPIVDSVVFSQIAHFRIPTISKR